ncbi:MAG: DUF5690 family protein [Chitinophagaceae bacterium]
MITSEFLRQKLAVAPAWLVSVFAATASFSVYFSMYAFRKPFTAASFEGMHFLQIDYKVWLVTAQVVGYMMSKFYGIRFIAVMQGNKRAGTIVRLILLAWIALLLFAVVPMPYNIIFLLVNGFPLGMIWGIVFSYVEGRKATEFIGAVLCTSFIFSSGVVKSIGKYLVINGFVSEFWMPFTTGALFIPPMLLFTWLLNHVPAPTEEDVRSRSIRKPMSAKERKQFVALFLPGIVMIVLTYVLLTVLRDFRDNFANELWSELGYGNQASIFTLTEIPVSFIVLFCMSLLILVKNNIHAFMINHYIIISGYLLAMLSTLLFMRHHIDAVPWMILVGTGLYTSYVPFNALYFERMIATYKINGNVGFIMYISDAFGYLGSVMILFIKQFFGLKVSWTNFFVDMILIISTFGIVGTIMASVYFKRKYASLQLPVNSLHAA